MAKKTMKRRSSAYQGFGRVFKDWRKREAVNQDMVAGQLGVV